MHSLGPRFILSLLLVSALILAAAQTVLADTSSLGQAKNQAAALEVRVRQLSEQAADLLQQYDEAEVELARTQTEAAENAALLVQAQHDQLTAEHALSGRLACIYKQGPSLEFEILLTSTSWSDLLNRMTLLERISKQDADLLAQVTTFRGQVAERQVRLAAVLKTQQTTADRMESAAEAVTQKLAENRHLLKGKEAQVAQLEREWQAKLAEEARKRQEREERQQEALADAQSGAQGAKPGGQSPTTTTQTSTTNQTSSTTRPASTTSTTERPSTTSTTARASTTSTTKPDSGGSQHNADVPNILRPEQIALVAQKAGFSGESLPIAVAVALAESGGDANAIGRLPTYGLWQIYSYSHPEMIDPDDPDASRWYDPYVNARFAWKISKQGTTWSPWSVYRSGAYLKYMSRAEAGVDLLLEDPQAVTPPTAK